MLKILTTITCGLLIILTSCTKEASSIDNVSPSNGATFHAGDVVRVSADLRNTDLLGEEMLIVLRGSNYTDTVLAFRDYAQTSKYSFSKEFICLAQTEYKIVIGAFGSGKSAVDSLYVFSD